MKRLWPAVVAVSAAVGLSWAGAAGASASGAAGSAGSWGRAIEVPGLGALNTGNAEVNSVSCGAAGSCAAVGRYLDRRGHGQGFVAVEKKGAWGRAVEVPGLGALNKGGDAGVRAVSCASAGNCTAAGAYRDRSRHYQGFVVSERNGVWGRAVEVPGLGTLNKDDAAVFSVSCASAGNCVAGGAYNSSRGDSQGFVAAETNGVWGQAAEVPGLGALNTGGAAGVVSVSCASAGNCVAGGDYSSSDNTQGFVAAETNGIWGQAADVPGLAKLNTGGGAGVLTVSCPSAGNCAAGGDYTDSLDDGQGFVAGEKNGVWGNAIGVPGLRKLNDDFSAEVDVLSCPSAGNCTAVGTYGEPYGTGFVAAEKNGVWGQADDVGIVGGRIAGANSVSCESAGTCVAGGSYSDSTGGLSFGWVAAERHGRWGNGTEVPAKGTLNKGAFAVVTSVSCPPAGRCAAGGYYTDSHHHSQGFVVSQS